MFDRSDYGDEIRMECPDCGVYGMHTLTPQGWECPECGALTDDEPFDDDFSEMRKHIEAR